MILAHTCNRAKGIIFFCSPLCLDRRQGIVTAHVCRKYSITPSMKHFKTTAVTLPYLPELALMFQRWQEGHMALSKGNISQCVLHDRKPADGIVAFWNFWITVTFLHDGQTASYPAWPGTKKDPIGLFLRRTMLEFSLSNNSPFNNYKWILEAKDFSLYLVLVLLHSSTCLMVGSGGMLFEFLQEAMQKPNTISATWLGETLQFTDK